MAKKKPSREPLPAAMKLVMATGPTRGGYTSDVHELINEGRATRLRARIYGDSPEEVHQLSRAVLHLSELINALHWAEALLASIRRGSTVTQEELITTHDELARLTELVPEF